MAADDPLHFSVIQKKPVSKMNRETQLWSFWTARTKRLVQFNYLVQFSNPD